MAEGGKDHTTDNDLSINTLHRGPKYKLNSPVSVTKDYALRFHFQIRYNPALPARSPLLPVERCCPVTVYGFIGIEFV